MEESNPFKRRKVLDLLKKFEDNRKNVNFTIYYYSF